MQKIFNNCYKMDNLCYKKFNLTEDILMEHAANSMQEYIRKNFDKAKILIVAGSGNNGADGITLARLLQNDYEVELLLPFGAKSDMAKLQLTRSRAVGVKEVEEIKNADIVVDCLFGAGLNRELNQESIEIIEQLNSLEAFKIACDIPSGISAKGNPSPIAFYADITITMGALKEALYADNAKDFVGEVIVANLGVSRELYESEDTKTFLLEKSDFNPPIRKNKNCHKGSFGHVAIFSGQKSGAAEISAIAASRFGAGLTTLIYHEKITPPPYIMTSTTLPKNTTAIAIGMGLGNFFEDDALQSVIDSNTPIVIDADALYKANLLEVIKQNREVVITPHPKEFSAVLKILNGQDIDIETIQKNRLKLAREFSQQYPKCTLLLKGANPIIAKNGICYINPLGDKVLAKGGSGDVLSGLIASLLAQGYSQLDATINGSLALALASKAYSKPNYFMLPTDIIDELANIVY